MKPISTKTHGILDYLTAGALLIVPRLLGWNKPITNLLAGSAVATVAYSLATDYELGAVKVIPMKGHLALDAVQSMGLATVPFVFNKGISRGVAAALLGMSLFEAVVLIGSQTEPPLLYRLQNDD